MATKASFIYLFISLVFISNIYAINPAKNIVKGQVFFDENQNGIKNDYEKGISGIRLYLSSGETILTDEKGHYSFEVEHYNKTSQIFIHTDTLPAGSIFSTPEKYNYSSQKQYVLKLDFGVYYEKTDFTLDDEVNTNGLFLHNPREYLLKVNLTKQGLSVGEKLLISRQEINNSPPRQEAFYLKINPSMKRFKESNIERITTFLKSDIDNVLSHEIIIPTRYGQGHEALIDSLFTQLTQYGIKNVKIKLTNSNQSDIKVTFTLRNELLCHYQTDKRSGQIEDGKTLDVPVLITNDQSLTFRCHKTTKSISVPYTALNGVKRGFTAVKNLVSNFSQRSIKLTALIDEKKIKRRRKKFNVKLKSQPHKLEIKNKAGYVFYYQVTIKKSNLFNTMKQEKETKKFVITTPKQLKLSRDFQQHIEFYDPENRSIEVNGRKLQTTRGHSSLMVHSKRGSNTLNIKRNNRKYKFNYKIMEEPIFEFTLKSGYNNINRSISDLNTEYTLGKVQQLEMNLAYFPLFQTQREWGIELKHITNTDGVTYILNAGTPIVKKQKETNVSVLRRFQFKPHSFRTIKYQLGLGYYQRKTSGRSDVTLFVPSDVEGISGQFNLLWENVKSENIDLSLKNFLVLNLNKPENYLFKTTAQIFYNLNDIGALFGMKPIYSNYYRYNYFQNLNFVISFGYENSKNTLINSPRGSVTESSTSFQSGILWRY